MLHFNSYNKSQLDAQFLNLISVNKSKMIWTDLLSIIRSLNTASDVILTSLAESRHNQYDKYQLLWIQY
jgi:hypothetical protein